MLGFIDERLLGVTLVMAAVATTELSIEEETVDTAALIGTTEDETVTAAVLVVTEVMTEAVVTAVEVVPMVAQLVVLTTEVVAISEGDRLGAETRGRENLFFLFASLSSSRRVRLTAELGTEEGGGGGGVTEGVGTLFNFLLLTTLSSV